MSKSSVHRYNCKGEKIWLIHQKNGRVETQSPLKTLITWNKASQIVGGGTTVLRVVSEDSECKTLDKTWQEVTDLIEAGQRVVYVKSEVDVDTNSTVKTAYVLTTSFHQISLEPSRQEDWFVYGIAYNVWNVATSELQLDAPSADSPLMACSTDPHVIKTNPKTIFFSI